MPTWNFDVYRENVAKVQIRFADCLIR